MGARSVAAGSPSGVALARERGAHQWTSTASIGLELPGVTFAEPAYARPLDWLLCDGLRRIADLDLPAESLYLRLSTRPIDQTPFAAAVDRLGEDRLRSEVIAGGYRLSDPSMDGRSRVVLVGSGAPMPEVLAAPEFLDPQRAPAVSAAATPLDRLTHGWLS